MQLQTLLHKLFPKKSRFLYGLATVLLIAFGTLTAYNRQVYATAYTWTGGGDGTTWNSAANWGGSGYPSAAADTATFNATASNVTIPSGLNIAGITTATGFTGTLTQGGAITLTNLTWGAGTFAGGSAAIAVNGLYTLSGGTFTSTSGTFTINAGTSTQTIWTLSGGTFNHNNGLVKFIGSGCNAVGTVNNASSLTLYNIEVATSTACNNSASIQPTNTIIASNNFIFTSGVLGGTWEVLGNVTIGDGTRAFYGTGTLTYTGTGSKTYTYTAGSNGWGPNLRVNNAAVSVSAAPGTTELRVTNLTLLAGTFTAPSGTLILGGHQAATEDVVTASAGATFNPNNALVKVTGNGSFCVAPLNINAPAGFAFYNLELDSISGCGYNVRLSNTNGVLVHKNFIFTGGIIFSNWQVEGNYSVGTHAVFGATGNATITFVGANNQTYTNLGGVDATGNITVNKTNGTVSLASAATWNSGTQSLTVTNGIFNMNGYNLSLGTGGLSVASGGSFRNTGSGGTLTLSGNVSNSGSIIIRGNNTCGGSDVALIRSNTTTQRTWSGAGSFILEDVDASYQAGSMTALSSTNSGNNAWTFTSACTPHPSSTGLPAGKLNLGTGKIIFSNI